MFSITLKAQGILLLLFLSNIMSTLAVENAVAGLLGNTVSGLVNGLVCLADPALNTLLSLLDTGIGEAVKIVLDPVLTQILNLLNLILSSL
ncbi:maker201 [Drosophila busckii]|uniref:Maker201 n=1 Tax=Drosophila busckii TaxID=30019 RepID=A0A0M5JCF6_DROBS|nr:maker201 [Drosophila busckii]